MKGYLVTKEGVKPICLTFYFIIILLLVFLFDRKKDNHSKIYFACFLGLVILLIISLFLLIISRKKYLSRIYLHNDYIEIKYKKKVLNKISVDSIINAIEYYQYRNKFIDIVYEEKTKCVFTLEYNENIIKYLSENQVNIIEQKWWLT